MSHYLEHVLDPRAELEAAARVLPAGGLLFIEVPDPESRLGRVLGSYWAPWFQPQHLNFLNVRNLARMLHETGFAPVRWERGEAHIPIDFTAVAYFAIGRIAPRADLPWIGEPRVTRRVWRALTWIVMSPVFVTGMLLDKVLEPLLRRPGWSNAFRVVARRLEGGPNAASSTLVFEE
jgi:SAM-dependent methyltransferase